MSGTVCLDVFRTDGRRKRGAGGLDARMAHPARLQRPGRQQTDPGSFLNSACYRFADFIFAISVRALENEFLSGTDVSMSYNYRWAFARIRKANGRD